ncbi:MAG: hypothetical protein IPM63_14765 [Acidobacteriota bacterium]|nr:MAG: hypothetical protein IPM63_14765 [Acidobacteriota bacterium]
MVIHFLRTGEKRYAVEIERDGLPLLELNPAPGFDARVPHDMMHLIVEAVLGLERAVFGQLAAGGDAGSFHVKNESDASGKDHSRLRRKQKKRGESIRAKEDGHFAMSENATYVCWHEWLSRSHRTEDRNKALSMKTNAAHIWDRMPAADKKMLQDALDRTCDHLDILSEAWSGLKAGQRISVRWPDLDLVEKG